MEQEMRQAVEAGAISLNDVCVAFKDWTSNPFFIGEDIPDGLKWFVARETGCSSDDVFAVYGKTPEKGTPWFAVLRSGLALRPRIDIGVEKQVLYLPWTSIEGIRLDDRNCEVPSYLYVSANTHRQGVLDLQYLSKADMELAYNSIRWLVEASDDGSSFWSKGCRRCGRMWDGDAYSRPGPNQVWRIWSDDEE